MIHKVIIVAFLISIVSSVKSQQFIGKTKAIVEQEMSKSYPGFAIDKSSVNHTYKYLKYINKETEQTLLVFLSEDDVCTATKLVSDYTNLIDVKKELNSKFKSAGKDCWKYTQNGIKCKVKLKRDEWFFSVFTSKDQ